MALPKLIVVSGPSGVGKTTLAHRVAWRIKCPAICRDEIKEGLVRSDEQYRAAPGDDSTVRASRLFFDVIGVLVEGGVTLVAEAAFQDKIWRPNLLRLADHADLRVLQCHTDPPTAIRRTEERGLRQAHDHAAVPDNEYYRQFDRVRLNVPSLAVDTTSDYSPTLDAIVSFINT